MGTQRCAVPGDPIGRLRPNADQSAAGVGKRMHRAGNAVSGSALLPQEITGDAVRLLLGAVGRIAHGDGLGGRRRVVVPAHQ